MKSTFRNLKKQKLYTGINILGLTMGMTLSVLILTYVWHERSFDRFNSNFKDTYRVIHQRNLWSSGEAIGLNGASGNSLATALKDEFPEIRQIARLSYMKGENDFEIEYEEKKLRAKPWDFLVADEGIFKVFDIEFIYGNPDNALEELNSIVLVEEESRRIFGDINPVGKFISVKDLGTGRAIPYTVSGVAKSMPVNSHFNFKFLKPLDNRLRGLLSMQTNTYLTLSEGCEPEKLESKFPAFVKKYFAPEIEAAASKNYDEWVESGGVWRLILQPLKKIHLEYTYDIQGSQFVKGSLFQVRILTVVAIFLIILACINFISLSTAKSGTRAKEIGIRKVSGANRKQLIRQYLTESFLFSFISVIISAVLVFLFSGLFNNLLHVNIHYDSEAVIFITTAFIIISVLVGFMAGSYPAFVLSSFMPNEVLKGQVVDKMKGIFIRYGLVVFQFSISIILIISSIVVYKQFILFDTKDLGFDKENILIVKNIDALWNRQYNNISEKEQRMATFQRELEQNQFITKSSFSSTLPCMLNDRLNRTDIEILGDTSGTRYQVDLTNIDFAFSEVFGIDVADGKNFWNEGTLPQSIEGVMMNEKAVQLTGLQNPLGKLLKLSVYKWVKSARGTDMLKPESVTLPIIGIYKDFNSRNLYNDIWPAIYLHFSKDTYNPIQFFSARIMPGDIAGTIAYLEDTWKKFVPDVPIEYSFYDKEFDNLYAGQKRLSQVFTFFTIMAIFIACLGILGLAAYTTEQRTKEIGIRKVMGASVKRIVKILSLIYVKILGIAVLIACPVGYILLNNWLQKYYYRINFGLTILVISVLIAAFVIFASVSYYSLKAALTNPSETLKYE
ncbi:MAG: ABC transporter permease [Prolixibacteraceae bacterium]|nr:ABC transporter permease [Prolixibacteraceae bacterium]